MAGDPESAATPVERLARLYFELSRGEGDPRMLELVHPDVEMVVRKLGGPRRLRGKEQVARFLEELPQRFVLYQSVPEEFTVVDEERVVVEGRLRWMDDQRVLRDDPVIWALEFREGLLYRSISARSVSEAQAILAAASGAPKTP